MGNNIRTSNLSNQPQITSKQNVQIQKSFSFSAISVQNPKEKAQKNDKINNYKSEILEPQKFSLISKQKKKCSSISIFGQQKKLSIHNPENNQETSLRTTSEQVFLDQRAAVTKSDPIGLRKKSYEFPQVQQKIDIRQVQKQIVDYSCFMPSSISDIGNTQTHAQLNKTMLSEQKFAQQLIKNRRQIIDSQRNHQDFNIKSGFIDGKKVLTENLELDTNKNDSNKKQSELDKIKEEELQQRCLNVFGLGFNQLVTSIQGLISTNKKQSYQNKS